MPTGLKTDNVSTFQTRRLSSLANCGFCKRLGKRKLGGNGGARALGSGPRGGVFPSTKGYGCEDYWYVIDICDILTIGKNSQDISVFSGLLVTHLQRSCVLPVFT